MGTHDVEHSQLKGNVSSDNREDGMVLGIPDLFMCRHNGAAMLFWSDGWDWGPRI